MKEIGNFLPKTRLAGRRGPCLYMLANFRGKAPARAALPCAASAMIFMPKTQGGVIRVKG